MNFIKINNSFINLSRTREINVKPILVSNRINPNIAQPTHEIEVIYNDRIHTVKVFAEGHSTEEISEALYSAIGTCTDADCEDLMEYLDEN